MCPLPPVPSISHCYLKGQERVALTVIDTLRNAADDCVACGGKTGGNVSGLLSVCSKVRGAVGRQAGDAMWRNIVLG